MIETSATQQNSKGLPTGNAGVGCDCIRRVDTQLKEGGHNTMLNTTLFGKPKCLVATVQIESGRGKKKAALMLATHCPFCGTEYPSSATVNSQVGTPATETRPAE